MPGPAKQDFTIYRGTAPILEFSVVDDNGVAVPIDAWTAVLTLRSSAADPDPVKLSKSGNIFGLPANGKFRVALTKAETLALVSGKYAYSFERTNAGSEDVLTIGVVTVRLDVLNPA